MERKTFGLDAIIAKDFMLVIGIGTKVTSHLLTQLSKKNISTNKLTYWRYYFQVYIILPQFISVTKFHNITILIICCQIFLSMAFCMYALMVSTKNKIPYSTSIIGSDKIWSYKILAIFWQMDHITEIKDNFMI
jgi:hypothetical protein